MKGNIDYFGKDRLSYLLYDCGGSDPAEVKASEERLATYGMQGFDVVRTDFATSGRELPQRFGHFGYGSMVIDAEGRLRGANLSGAEVFALLQSLLAPADAADPADPDAEAPAFAVRTRVEVQQSGRPGFDLSRKLPRAMLATAVIELQLPAGYHVYGLAAANPCPTTVTVAYHAGLEVGAVALPGAVDVGGGAQHVQGPVHIELPVEVPAGTPIGQYPLHGTLRFMACDERHCLPPVELRWHVVVSAL